jgi:O-antigen ligase
MSYAGLILLGIFGYIYATQPELFEANRVLGSVGRDSNLTGRSTLWAIARAAIDERPWLGWSFDALESLPSRYSIRFNQFHNGYLDLMVRGGMIALGFVIFFALSTAFRIIKLAPGNKKMAASYGVLLLIIMMQNTSETTFGTAPNPLWLLFTFLYIGVSPQVTNWYETGVLEAKKKKALLSATETAEISIAPLQPITQLQRGINRPRRNRI